ncbi:MAG: hypothetical protein HOQ43_10700 [Glycomyces artemisiae]|uniref:Uncharacterized protein n=1 Tax=Glycomyces artemisiae TaxID=1076443 RepID=A0A850C6N3_9ACTN|nr:hypothetical protein [Glycomyces artemisiae]
MDDGLIDGVPPREVTRAARAFADGSRAAEIQLRHYEVKGSCSCHGLPDCADHDAIAGVMAAVGRQILAMPGALALFEALARGRGSEVQAAIQTAREAQAAVDGGGLAITGGGDTPGMF